MGMTQPSDTTLRNLTLLASTLFIATGCMAEMGEGDLDPVDFEADVQSVEEGEQPEPEQLFGKKKSREEELCYRIFVADGELCEAIPQLPGGTVEQSQECYAAARARLERCLAGE